MNRSARSIDPTRAHLINQLPGAVVLVAAAYLGRNSGMATLATILFVLALFYMALQLLRYGVVLGVFLPPDLRSYKASTDPDIQKVISIWTSAKPQYDCMMHLGMGSKSAFEWVSALESINKMEDSSFIELSYTLDNLGMTAKSFLSLWAIGVEDADTFITIAKHDLDKSVVEEIFPLVTERERFMRRVADLSL